MLDEFLEYDDYTNLEVLTSLNGEIELSNEEKEKLENLTRETVTRDSLNGLERILTIIARYRLFHVYDYNKFNSSSPNDNKEITVRNVSEKHNEVHNKEDKSESNYKETESTDTTTVLTQRDVIDIVKTELASWCGFEFDPKNKLENKKELQSYYDHFPAKGWLKSYYEKVANYCVSIDGKGTSSANDKIKERIIRPNPTIMIPTKKAPNHYLTDFKKIDRVSANLIYSWDEIVQKKQEDFTNDLFTDNLSINSKNTYKSICYERIIADAINYGPLHRYCLVCKNTYLENLGIVKEKSRKKEKFIEIDDIEYTDSHQLLKYIAAYLIDRKNCKKDYANVNLTSFGHWINDDISKHNWLNTICLKDQSNVETKEFKKLIDNVFLDNVRMTMINPKYIANNEFMIIDESKMDNFNFGDDYLVYCDGGAGKLLKPYEAK